MSTDYILQTTDLTKEFKGFVAVDKVNLQVQRGTIHNWVNRGTAPCVLAVILIDAKPVEAGGKVLQAEG